MVLRGGFSIRIEALRVENIATTYTPRPSFGASTPAPHLLHSALCIEPRIPRRGNIPCDFQYPLSSVQIRQASFFIRNAQSPTEAFQVRLTRPWLSKVAATKATQHHERRRRHPYAIARSHRITRTNYACVRFCMGKLTGDARMQDSCAEIFMQVQAGEGTPTFLA